MKDEKYNLAVIGGGAAGMFAAGHAAELGSKVILLEKKDRLGIKLMITGKGRCNITNAEEDIKSLIKNYGENGKFLHSAFHNFSNKDTVNFFESHNLPIKVERGNRIFPVSDKSHDIISCLKDFLKDNNVKIKLNSSAKKIITKNNQIEKIILETEEEIFADNFIFCTGGKSYPLTGSDGSAYKLLKQIGHTIVDPKPSLTPIIVKEKFISDLEGLSLKNVEISLWQNKKITSEFGEAIFTGNGLSGPIILNLSRIISQNDLKDLQIKIDFKPALDFQTVDKRIQHDFEEQKNKQFKNSLDKLLPQKLIPVIIKLSGIKPNKQVNEISKEERKKITKLLKEFTLTFQNLVGFEKAIVTMGGVDLHEVDSKTCRSKLFNNLYFAGEILDIDGPTGGYNLQVAWSTAHLAAQNLSN
jgi:predicted Rossmann fold flavoprotein